MKALVGAFNQEKALVEAFSVIVQLHRLIDLRHYLPPVHGGAEGGGGDHRGAEAGAAPHLGHVVAVLILDQVHVPTINIGLFRG